MGSNDQSQIVMGKPVKRQRSSSPFGNFAVTDSSSSGPTTSGEIYESTEEEEDMANCLIMLAQGGDGRGPRKLRKLQQDHICNKTAMITSDNNNNNNKVKSAASAATATAVVGSYVYECKTCNRSFPSFQALGGHRASHKKPKAISTSEAVAVLVPLLKDDYKSDSSPIHHHHHQHIQVACSSNNNKGNKIHECSICGSEFTSGQALGGHMRRHRAAANNNTINQVTIESNIGDVKPAAVSVTTRSILPLDLNLPAPEDDHHIRFGIGSTTQQSLVVFSASSLVDCHY